jgi:beta-lactamase regulating signal transducer with metallopeptidase domain
MNRVLSAFVNGAVLSFALTAVVALILRLIPRHVLNAATRYVLWWVTLVIALALPVLYLPMPQFHAAPSAASTRPAPIQAAPIAAPAFAPIAIARPAPVLEPERAPLFPIRIAAAGWPRWVLSGWLLASVALLLRLAVSSILLHRIASRACDAPAGLRSRARAALSLCGATRRGVRLADSPEITIPAAIGPRHPSILIPSALFGELEERELDQIVLHEAAHLARRDDYALLLQRIVEALLALHPAVRWIAHRIDLEREIACDDLVIAATGQARSYATCLTRIVELSGGVRPSMAAASAADDASHLARRVDMLLDKTRHTGTRLLKARLTAMVALVAALVLLAARAPGFVAFATPLARTIQAMPTRILAAMPLLASAAQDPPAAPQEFEGRVIEDSSGNALASAEVRFRHSGKRELTADLDTDRLGRVRTSILPAGDYTVEVTKPNFVTATLQIHVPSGAMLVRLVRYGVIAGQVTDQQGRPAPGIIHAPYGQAIGGTRISVLVKNEGAALKSVREETVDEDGRYRIYDLPPGQYVVGMWYDGLKDGSGFQLYPDNAHPKLFTIGGGEEFGSIDFQIVPSTTYQVSGRVEGATGKKQFALSLGLPEQPAFPIAQTLTRDDGTFTFERVPMGNYDLFVGGPQQGYGARSSVVGANALYARSHVTVSGQNVEGLSISASPGRAVAAVLSGHGSETPPQGCPSSATVGVTPLEPWGLMLMGEHFTTHAEFGKAQSIRDLPPGHFQLVASGLPAGCYQANVAVADLSGEAPGPVLIELASAGSIHGVLRGAPADASGYAIVLLESGSDAASQSRLAFPDAQSRFAYEGLRPGRYRIAAQLASEPKSRWVADISKMVEIEVLGGSPTSLDLPIPAKAGVQ